MNVGTIITATAATFALTAFSANAENPKPSGEKPTKRVNLVFRCTETGKGHSPAGKRAKKFELIDK